MIFRGECRRNGSRCLRRSMTKTSGLSFEEGRVIVDESN